MTVKTLLANNMIEIAAEITNAAIKYRRASPQADAFSVAEMRSFIADKAVIAAPRIKAMLPIRPDSKLKNPKPRPRTRNDSGWAKIKFITAEIFPSEVDVDSCMLTKEADLLFLTLQILLFKMEL